MAEKKRRLYIVCYDIADPRRLTRVHRQLSRQGIPLQYSVFLLFTHPVGLQRVLAALRGRIDEREDDVRAYPVAAKLDYVHRGRALFPEGIDLRGLALPAGLARAAAAQTPSKLSLFI